MGLRDPLSLGIHMEVQLRWHHGVLPEWKARDRSHGYRYDELAGGHLVQWVLSLVPTMGSNLCLLSPYQLSIYTLNGMQNVLSVPCAVVSGP